MEIKPNTQKNFIIARVGVNKDDLIGKKFFSHDDAEIVIPMGYSLFYTKERALEQLGTGKERTVKGRELADSIEKQKKTTLYWLRKSNNNDYEIIVPWGIVLQDGKGFNGQIKIKFNIESDDCDFISKCMCACETEMKDGLNYEYLSEYYVDEKNRPQGLSVAIRELLVPGLKGCKNKEEIENTINALAKDLVESGLLLDEKSIVVNDKRLIEGGK